MVRLHRIQRLNVALMMMTLPSLLFVISPKIPKRWIVSVSSFSFSPSVSFFVRKNDGFRCRYRFRLPARSTGAPVRMDMRINTHTSRSISSTPSTASTEETAASPSTGTAAAVNDDVDSSTAAATTTTTSAATQPNLPQELSVDYTMENIVNLCKRRGIIFPSSEIYGGFAGFFDYGHIGTELKRNVKDIWWRRFVVSRQDMVGLDSSIIHNPNVWRASGHVEGFSDPMVDCKETKLRYRADQLFYSAVTVQGEHLGFVCVQEANDQDMIKEAKRQAKALLKELNRTTSEEKSIDPFHFLEFTTADAATMAQIPSPASGKPTLTLPRDFNLMFQTNVGAMVSPSDSSSSSSSSSDTTTTTSTAYLRPETAQGIFINYKNILTTCRLKIPFGIAQIGKAFRNEITPRNFIFRSREFEQMEIEYFIPPGDEPAKTYHAQWIAASHQFLLDIGIRPELLQFQIHDKLAHYATACTDITFTFPSFGQAELMGIAARGNYDLTQHSNASGKALDYYDEETKEKYIPHVIEPSLGVDRVILALICSAYAKDVVGGEERSLLKFHPCIAPIKVAVLPLLKNKPALVEAARALYQTILQRQYTVTYDESGAIGRRYRRADEVGIPFCITVDFETIESPDRTVTIRDRDTTHQMRLPIDQVLPYLSKAIHGYE